MLRFRIMIFAAAALLLGIAFGYWFTPAPSTVRQLAMGSDRVLLAADGQPLQTLRTDFKKRRLSWTPLARFSSEVQHAVILSEDKRFRSHIGVDPPALGRAAGTLFKGRRMQGASTITMQVSDLIQPDVLSGHTSIQKGSLVHKCVQMVRAVFLEMKWSKDEILEAYLNLIHLRGEFQGVPALTQAFLKKYPLSLSKPESVVIASMIPSPNQSAKILERKACHLFRRWSPQETDCAPVAEAVRAFFAHSPGMPPTESLAPHLARRLFNEYPQAQMLTSTIDANLQQQVTAILEKSLYRLKEQNVHDSAAIVIENATGRVLAYVGAVESSESPHVDGVIAYRQPGSALKPFIYAKALDMKTLTPASILLDDPTAISWGGGVYRPANYDRHFYGPVSVREALASSLNVPAVKTVTIVGLHQTYQLMQALGFTNLKEPDFYGVSMALGAVEVKLQELANAYRMLANKGMWSPLRFVQDAKDEGGSRRVFSEEAAFQISSILSDPDARAIGFGSDSPLETPFWSAVKTGTSKDYRDNWCAGFSEKYTVTVWTGNFNAEAMHKVSGVSGAGPAWFEIMNVLHRNLPSRAPVKPANIVAKKIRHQWSSYEHDEYFIAGTEPAGSVIETAPDKRAQFVFPAEGSVLVKDPQLDPANVALFVRFKGQVPQKSTLMWDGVALGEAASPFKLESPQPGKHHLSIVGPDGKVVSSVNFTIRGVN